jgi:hypothetical protein
MQINFALQKTYRINGYGTGIFRYRYLTSEETFTGFILFFSFFFAAFYCIVSDQDNRLADIFETILKQQKKLYLSRYLYGFLQAFFYIERDPRSRMEIGERDTQVVHVNEATVAWPEAIACHRPRRLSGAYQAMPPPPP